MGVPALFRWLSKKYPKIVSQVKEELPRELENGDGTKTTVPVEMTDPNPNGVEFDNLYLDFNGIVHPCSHPEDRPAPETEEDMMRAIFEYTDRVVNMVRPRNLLYIAVDGVAPRAKMNQQRSRRFKSAQEAAEKDAAAAEHHAMLVATGQRQADDETDKPKKVWDSNSITPGTPFMNTLALSLRYWINYKQSTDPGWKNLKTIISDASVPGEGEHKIMNFIRSQRQSPNHDPNTRHVMYGLDADLIMLGLVTHEVHFRIIREDVFANDTKPGHCRKCNQPGHIAAHCQGKAAPKPGEGGVDQPLKPYVWLNVEVLREYLAVEMQVPQQPFPFDLERAIDDWVFMCFFVGNDFLPHLPSLDIREDGIDTLIAIWRDNIPFMGGYLTNDGSVDLNKAQRILDGLASQENAIFKRRKENEIQREAAAKRREDEKKRRESNKRPRVSNGNGGPGSRGGKIRGELPPDPDALPIFAPSDAQTRNDPRYAKETLSHADIVGGKSKAGENKSAAAALKERMMNAAASGGATNGDASQSVLGKRTRDMIDDAAEGVSSDPSTPGRHTPINTHDKGTSGQLGGNSTETDAMPEDTVKLWEDGYEDRYYAQKFKVAPDNIEFRRQIARAYTEGLCWVLLYYLQGCPSWTWYYPYHYAPFASDFKDMGSQVVNFEKGKPFRPYEQLMGVLPASSNHAIPLPFHPLMTEEDSPIKEFYPTEFETDLNGKKFAWQGVVLLPFIDEKRLLDAMNTKYPDLSDDERKRNEVGSEVLIVSNDHPIVADLHGSFYGKSKNSDKIKLKQYNCGLAGTVSKDESYMPWGGVQFPLESAVDKFPALETTGSTMASYQMPVSKHLHKSMLLAMVKFDEPALDYNDIQKTRQMAKTSGRQFGGVKLTNDGGRSDGRQIHYGARGGHSNGNHHHQQNHNPIANLPPHLAAQAAQHGIMPNMPPGFPAGGPGMPNDYRQPPPRHQDRYPPQSNGQDRGYGGGYQQNGGYYQGGNGGGYGGGGYGGDRYNGGGYGGSNGQRNNNGGDRYGNDRYSSQGYGQNGGQYNGGRGGRRY